MSGFWRFLRYGLLGIANLVALLIAIPVIYLTAGSVYQSRVHYTHHYRLVLEIEDHGEIRTGSSVIGVSFSPTPPWTVYRLGSPWTRFHGEAVVVELSTGQVVVATLMHGPRGNTEQMQSLASRTLGANAPGNLRDARNWTGKGEVTGSDIPSMLLFKSRDEPSGGRWVAPDEFEEKIGPNIQLRRMTLEMTSDPVTRQIEEKLPFMARDWDELREEARSKGGGVPQRRILTR